MPRESAKCLHDILQAADRILTFTAGCDLGRYSSDEMLQSAVERQFEIAGEALAQLVRHDPATAARITDHLRIISFRSILIHGYAEVDSRVVWDILSTKVDTLRAEVQRLLGESDR